MGGPGSLDEGNKLLLAVALAHRNGANMPMARAKARFNLDQINFSFRT